LTYAHLIEKYNYLNRYISKVKVIDNLNILCNLVSIEQINEFITYLQEILKYKSNWKSVKIKNINEGYFYRKKLPADAKALILSDEYTNEYVIGYFDTLPPYKKIKSGPFDVYKWRGFYSSSSIKGLIDKPYRIYVSPNYGFLEYYNNENNYKVVVNQNEYKIDLFDIKLEKEDLPILKETCNLLWENGYFLTEWSTAMFLINWIP
jgi:hypothetical protein